MSSTAVEQDVRPVPAQPAPRDLYRLVVLQKSGGEILVANERPPFTLPCAEIPRWERVAENLIEAVRKRYGISAICLFKPAPSNAISGGERPLYQVMETRETRTAVPDEMRWLTLDSIADQSFADEQDLVAITNTARQMAEFQSGEAIGPFGKPGWIEELFSWVQRQVGRYGFHLTGNFRQLNASPTFSLIRLETNAQAVWFKGVGDPNVREFSMSIFLAKHFPDFMPKILATDPGCHGWLTWEVSGETLDQRPDPEAWETSARTLAQLEIASSEHTDASVEPFFDLMVHLMAKQPKEPPAALSSTGLGQLSRDVEGALRKWCDLHIPNSLGHLDFNPGNIVCSSHRCVFLDWAEGFVGPPFLTLQYLLVHLAKQSKVDLKLHQELQSTYAKEWESVMTPRSIRQALALAPVLAVFAYAVADRPWQNGKSSIAKSEAAYLRALTRRLQAEVATYNEERRAF
jgi:hypothetical protein